VIGAGYVGLVTAAGFAELGSEVHCVDIDRERIAKLQEGVVPIYEPGLDELLAANRQRLHFSSELGGALARAELIFVAVGTPPTPSGDADLSAVQAVVDAVRAAQAEAGERRRALVMKSTVPCGTGAAIERSLASAGERAIAYVSCPEFLREGSAVEDFRKPDRVVIGDRGDWAGDAVLELYRPLIERSAAGGREPLVRTDIASAEMIKLASNAFLATKISFINEIANVCEETGADVAEVARGMGLDRRIGPDFLRAGIGYGGSCFTKDVSALKLLAGNSGYHFQLLSAVIEVNELQKRRVVTKIERHLGALAERKIALLGLAFKPNTDDMRGAASVVLASRLLSEGAHVSAYDPVASARARELLPAVAYEESALAALTDADAGILVTEWPELVALDWRAVAELMRGHLIVDGRNALDPDAVGAAGLTYEGIGLRERRMVDRAGAGSDAAPLGAGAVVRQAVGS
jgi:UDPglucose 6-dehydrogenase